MPNPESENPLSSERKKDILIGTAGAVSLVLSLVACVPFIASYADYVDSASWATNAENSGNIAKAQTLESESNNAFNDTSSADVFSLVTGVAGAGLLTVFVRRKMAK